MTSAPGITSESRNRGIQIDGASGADNRFMIDGVDTTNLLNGTSGKSLPVDFVDTVQAKASGYAAEYRASLGGVISAITKSGGNQYHGSVGIYYTGDNLQGDVRQTLRLDPTNQNRRRVRHDPGRRLPDPEPIFDLGGPILRSGSGSTSATTRPGPIAPAPCASATPARSAPSARSRSRRSCNYNVTGQITGNLRGRFAASNQRDEGGYGLPNSGPNGVSTSNPALFPAVIRRDGSNDSYSGVLDWVVNNRTYVNVTTTRFKIDQYDVGTFSDALRHTFQASNFQFPEIPASLQKTNGFADNPSSSRFVQGGLSRFNFNADVTRYVNWRGQHTIKGGFQLERIVDDTLSGEQAATVQLFWDQSYALNDGRRLRGPYGYYNVVRFVTIGDIESNNVGLFVQDAWTLNRKLTLNLGVRTESEDVPSYRENNPGVNFDFSDKIAPRAGFAYDVRGDSQWKVYGSAGACSTT